jgi:hypothetical protein
MKIYTPGSGWSSVIYCSNCGHSEEFHRSSKYFAKLDEKTGKREVLRSDRDFCKYIIQRYDNPKEMSYVHGHVAYGYKSGDWCNCKNFKL